MEKIIDTIIALVVIFCVLSVLAYLKGRDEAEKEIEKMEKYYKNRHA